MGFTNNGFSQECSPAVRKGLLYMQHCATMEYAALQIELVVLRNFTFNSSNHAMSKFLFQLATLSCDVVNVSQKAVVKVIYKLLNAIKVSNFALIIIHSYLEQS
jgi:hypothetical protein